MSSSDRTKSSLIPKKLSCLWKIQSKSITILSDVNLSLNKYCLDEIGGFIWKLCDGRNTVDDIAKCLESKCKRAVPSHNTVVNDIYTLLQSLQAEGLITWQEHNSIDVLLVVPPAPSVYSPKAVKTPEYSAPPLGLCYIAAVLRENGFRVAIVDMHQFPAVPEDIVKKCRELNPKIVGITSSTPSYPNALRVACFVKAWNQDVITVIGGPHATCIPKECICSDSFDFVCIGEGEISMFELVRALIRGKENPQKILGFAHKSNGKITFSSPRQKITNLDTLPFPARNLLKLDNYYQKGSIVSSRGCPIGCNYCACAAISGNTYRANSIDYILKEVKQMMGQYGFRFFDFHDDTFNLNANRVFRFCNEVEKRRMKFEWGCFCRVAPFTFKMAETMANAGCRVVQFGVESGSDSVLKAINKKTTVKQIKNAVSAAKDAGIEQIVCGFIIGHPQDTEDSVKDTIELGLGLSKLGATRLTLSLLTPYPGTEVFEERKRLGIKLITDDWEQYTFSRVVIETRHLNKERLRELYTDGILKFLEASKY